MLAQRRGPRWLLISPITHRWLLISRSAATVQLRRRRHQRSRLRAAAAAERRGVSGVATSGHGRRRCRADPRDRPFVGDVMNDIRKLM